MSLGAVLLKYNIAVEDKNAEFASYLAQGCEVLSLPVARIDDACAEVTITERSSLFGLSTLLADFLIENIQVNYITRAIRGVDFVTNKEKYQLLVRTLREAWFGADGEVQLEIYKKEVAGRILKCLLERNTLTLDGVFRFRMKDIADKCEHIIDAQLEAMLLENEKQEFVKLLRYFVSMKEPSDKKITLAELDGEYVITDETGLPIDMPDALGMQAASREDKLLSKLIAISPQTITVDGKFDDTEIEEIIGLVFVGRVTKQAMN